MTDNKQDEIEDKVIDCVNFGSEGRLVIVKPENNNFGADLFVERRSKYKENGIYLQINDLVKPGNDKGFVKDFLQEKFKPKKDFYMLFLSFDEILQKIDKNLWLIPSLQFRDIAEVVKSPSNENLLRFKASLDVKEKNQYSKFIIETKNLGDLILDALENKGKFDFKKMGIKEEEKINVEGLKEFICEARQNTFAGQGSPIDNPRLQASIQMEFQKGEYTYRDIFFNGTEKFIGQEIVYHNARPVWGMNYMATQIGRIEIDFLKEALLKLADKCRFGGVCEYEKREYKYKDKGEGNVGEFHGREEIFFQDKNIFTLTYHGGLIVK